MWVGLEKLPGPGPGPGNFSTPTPTPRQFNTQFNESLIYQAELRGIGVGMEYFLPSYLHNRLCPSVRLEAASGVFEAEGVDSPLAAPKENAIGSR